MKYKNMPAAEPRDGDSEAMRDAIDRLTEHGVDVRRSPKSLYQLKVANDLSYYPTQQTIFRDGDPGPLRERGLKALLAVIEMDDLPTGLVF